MKKLYLIIVAVACIVVFFLKSVQSQIIDIKKWKGTYPDMEKSYPLTFIAFKGWLIPKPHVFVRTWPTHYYIEADAVPVTDATEIGGATVTGLLRIAAKMLERHQVKGRHDETSQIKDNTDLLKQIEERIFNSRTDQLDDLYSLAQCFIELYEKIERLEKLSESAGTEDIFEEEADGLLMRLLMVNLLETGHGEKIDAFSEIKTTLNNLIGEVDYTWSKIRFFMNSQEEITSYSFLTR